MARGRTIAREIFAAVRVAMAGLAAVCAVAVTTQFLTAQSATTIFEESALGIKMMGAIAPIDEQSTLVSRAPAQLDMGAIGKDQKRFNELSADIDASLLAVSKENKDAKMGALIAQIQQQLPNYRKSCKTVFDEALNFQQQEAVNDLSGKVFPFYENLKGLTRKLKELVETKAHDGKLLIDEK